MFARTRLPLRPALSRSYANRLPTRPPPRGPDPLLNNPHAAYKDLPDNLTFIHRPPPSAASPESYITAPASPLLTTTNATKATKRGDLPPPLHSKKPSPQRMSDADIEKMRSLRQKNPTEWTAGKLAKEFNCTQMFVRLMAPLKKSQRRVALARRDADHEEYRARWGEKAWLTKEIRAKRREFW